VLVPGLLEQILCGQECGERAHQGLEDSELLDRQLQWPPVAGRDPRCGVELDTGHAHDAGSRGGLPPGERVDAQHELGEMERFGEVVVGAEAQAADPVIW
jgi:hypothetical protein